MSAADIPAADKIIMSGFGQSESRLEEMRRYLEIQPDGYFVAEQAGILLGMVGAVTYGAFAYIGLMVVWPEFQGRGIGRLLMERLLGWLDQRGTPSLLDATEMGYPLYKKMGFVETDLSSVYIQDQPVGRQSSASPVYRLQPGDLDELVTFDTPLFGADRRNVLRVMMRDYPGGTLATRDEAGRISSYLIIRDSRLSPWMAHDPASAERVLQEALDSTLPGHPVALVPGVNQAGLEILERYGFRFKRSCRHMQRGMTAERQRSQTYGMISYAIG